MEAFIWLCVFSLLILMGRLFSLAHEKENLEKQNYELSHDNQKQADLLGQWESYAETLKDSKESIDKRENLFRQLFQERTQQYPVVGQAWSELIEITEEERARALSYKKQPALKAADEVKAIKHEKRALVKELMYWKYKSHNYEAVYPWLAEELEQDIQNEVDAEIYYSVYSKQERSDPAAEFLSPEDYRKLDPIERNQRALDRYWLRGKKSKWMIGKMYERYVGYLYEMDGWDVEYFGIHKRFEDLGRDLIARKGKEVHIIQCKNWSKFKTIYENHIFQLFGTSYGYQKEHPDKKVIAVFYCTTKLSDTADEFANRLGIEVHQNEDFNEYPCIKCNISSKGERIYHLPFDQQYDTIKITPKTGEYYAANIAEAEADGFRRALKWSGSR